MASQWERREGVRERAAIPAKIRVDGRTFVVVLIDVGSGGAFAVTGELLPPRSEVLLRYADPEKGAIVVKARVLRSGPDPRGIAGLALQISETYSSAPT